MYQIINLLFPSADFETQLRYPRHLKHSLRLQVRSNQLRGPSRGEIVHLVLCHRIGSVVFYLIVSSAYIWRCVRIFVDNAGLC